MSKRGLIIGLLGAIFISSGGVLNSLFLGLEHFTSGHFLPVIVVGLLSLFVLLVNPLLLCIGGRLKRRLAFSAKDMALIVLLWSTACCIPNMGLLTQFTHVMVMPYHWYKVTPGWQREKVLDYVPKSCMVDWSEETHEQVVTTYINGTAAEDRSKGGTLNVIKGAIQTVPWRAWRRPLLIWAPVFFLVIIASACLSMITYRQWSEHEHLAFPLAEFTSRLIERKEGQLFPIIFQNRLFWIGLLIMVVIRVNNGLCVWYPEYYIPVKLNWQMQPFSKVFPAIFRVQWGNYFLNLSIFPLVVAFSFFLSTEISFTLGISQFCWLLVGAPMVYAGMNLSTDWIGGWQGWQRCGSYITMAAILFYTGREYYLGLTRKALWLMPTVKGERDTGNIWAMRVLIFCSVALVVCFKMVGMEMPFALLTALGVLFPFVLVARISAETGLFFIQPRWTIFGVLSAGFGAYFFNPSNHILCAYISAFLCMDQCEAFMPYLTNCLRITDRAKIKESTACVTSATVCIIAAALAIAVILVGIYGFEGVRVFRSWQYQRLPTMPFRSALPDILHLRALGLLDAAEGLPWWQRLSGIAPRPTFLGAFIFGVVSVLVCGVLRLRCPKWPIHPVMFLLWATWPMMVFNHSIFMGWLIKKGVLHFAGIKAAKRLTPFMYGIIAGEVMAAIGFMIFGAIYYWNTGERPLRYFWFP